jgi:phosphomevalonate kinase
VYKQKSNSGKVKDKNKKTPFISICKNKQENSLINKNKNFILEVFFYELESHIHDVLYAKNWNANMYIFLIFETVKKIKSEKM